MVNVNLADVYKVVPVRKENWKFLGIHVKGNYYLFYRRLPMSAASSCQLFQRINDVITAMLYRVCKVEVRVITE